MLVALLNREPGMVLGSPRAPLCLAVPEPDVRSQRVLECGVATAAQVCHCPWLTEEQEVARLQACCLSWVWVFLF